VILGSVIGSGRGTNSNAGSYHDKVAADTRSREEDDGEISVVVHSACVLLAAGSGGAGALSNRVAVTVAISHRGHRGGRGARTDKRDHLSTRAGVAGSLIRTCRCGGGWRTVVGATRIRSARRFRPRQS
jgi:hypothetical protein